MLLRVCVLGRPVCVLSLQPGGKLSTGLGQTSFAVRLRNLLPRSAKYYCAHFSAG